MKINLTRYNLRGHRYLHFSMPFLSRCYYRCSLFLLNQAVASSLAAWSAPVIEPLHSSWSPSTGTNCDIWTIVVVK